MTTPQTQPKRGIVKQVLSGDSVIIRGTQGAPPPEKQLNFSSIIAPKLARRATDNADVTKDEPYAWEAREFLRKKLVGEEVWFTAEKPPNATREYGVVRLGKDFTDAENITHSLVSEGLVTVRREGVRITPEIEELVELENKAKAAGKGKWGGNLQDHVRDITWSIDNPHSFYEKHKGKPIKAVIEHVRDGSTVRAFLLPDFHHVTVMMTGIRCNGYKLDQNGRPDPNEKLPFADEARYFVEIRLLQRDVEILLESTNNANFIGTIVHPRGNIAELLLKEGLARCVDWSMKLLMDGGEHGAKSAERLRAAERHAKEARLRLWKDWQSNAPQISGKEKDFQGTVVEVVNGDALMVKIGKGQVKKIFLSSIRPPREAARGNDEDGKPMARPRGFRPLYDVPWMFEAREFLRKKLVDKRVRVVVDYIQEARDNFPEKVCATVTVGGANVAEALVSKGLATVVKYRQDDDQRSSHYDDLLHAENKAAKSQKGLHDKKNVPVHRVIEIDAAKSKQYLSSFKRQNRIDAIVEFVASGSRLRLYIPKETCLCTFLLAGISCPRGARPATGGTPASAAEPFGEEALQFTKDLCLQKEVQIQVESTDKAGNFIGWLFVDVNNLSVLLLDEGFATVHPTADRSVYYKQLKAAEDKAKEQQLRRWKDYVEEKVEQQKIEEDNANPERTVSYEEICVTEVTAEGTFFAQTYEDGPKAEQLLAKLRQELEANRPLPGAYAPKRGDLCAARYTADDLWYRARVEKVHGGGAKADVRYVDYGNRETVSVAQLAALPAAYQHQRPFAVEYALACVQLPKDPEFADIALKYLRDDLFSGKLLLNVEYRPASGLPAATVLTEEAKEDVVKNLITDGLLLVEKRRERRLNKLVTEYLEAQDVAKKNHANIWQYGDITEDDAKEFGA